MAFHFCRERIAVKVVFVVWTKSEDNLADMFTKSQSGPVVGRTSKRPSTLVLHKSYLVVVSQLSKDSEAA